MFNLKLILSFFNKVYSDFLWLFLNFSWIFMCFLVYFHDLLPLFLVSKTNSLSKLLYQSSNLFSSFNEVHLKEIQKHFAIYLFFFFLHSWATMDKLASIKLINWINNFYNVFLNILDHSEGYCYKKSCNCLLNEHLIERNQLVKK